MGVLIGNNEFSRAFVGNNPVRKIFIGDEQVYPPVPEPFALKFEAKEEFYISVENRGNNRPNLEYTFTKTGAWETWDYSTIHIPANGKIYVRGNNPNGFSKDASNVSAILVSANGSSISPVEVPSSKVSGDIRALLGSLVATLPSYCFAGLFSFSGLVDASGLLLCEAALGQSCYLQTFYSSSLKFPPQLPATTLKPSCYSGMFGSTKIEVAPDLPAGLLQSGCYTLMFSNCHSLKYIKCLASSTPYLSTGSWVAGVSASGVFVKKRRVQWPAGDSGIPEGWTIEEV